jgi:4a-hydroxytetrahydrobiopterin dehydratase
MQLAATPGWTRAGDKLTRTFEFADFVAAFGWMASVALVAERMNHHPEWFNVYRTVKVELATHDAGGITALDFELARAMSELA